MSEKRKPPNAGKGRPKGSLNKATRDVQEATRAFLSNPKGLKALELQYEEGKLPPAVWQTLMHYAYGKPKDTLALESPAPLEIPILRTRADILAVLGEPDIDAGGDLKDDED